MTNLLNCKRILMILSFSLDKMNSRNVIIYRHVFRSLSRASICPYRKTYANRETSRKKKLIIDLNVEGERERAKWDADDCVQLTHIHKVSHFNWFGPHRRSDKCIQTTSSSLFIDSLFKMIHNRPNDIPNNYSLKLSLLTIRKSLLLIMKCLNENSQTEIILNICINLFWFCIFVHIPIKSFLFVFFIIKFCLLFYFYSVDSRLITSYFLIISKKELHSRMTMIS